MDTPFSNEERQLFEKLKGLRTLVSQVDPAMTGGIDRIYIREIIYNHLSKSGISTEAAAFDALTDDIEGYIKKSFDDFVAFSKDRKN